jgi:hypothetical protein
MHRKDAQASYQSLESLESTTHAYTGDPGSSPQAPRLGKSGLRGKLPKGDGVSGSDVCDVHATMDSTASSEGEYTTESPRKLACSIAGNAGTIAEDGTDASKECTVYEAEPLFDRPQTVSKVLLDLIVISWAFCTHLCVTAWPYMSLLILAGLPSALIFDVVR